ncbi:MAG: sugar transferase, partial [Archangium sp.]
MLRVFHHYFSSRKLTLFVIEGAAIALACLLGAAGCAKVLAPANTHLPLAQSMPALLFLGATFVPTFQ